MKLRRLIGDVIQMVRLRRKIRRAVRERAERDGVPFGVAWSEHVSRLEYEQWANSAHRKRNS